MNKPLLTLIATAITGVTVTVSSLVLAQPTKVPRTEPPKFIVAQLELPDKTVREALQGMLDTIEANDYANFVRPGTEEFKAQLTNPVFRAVADSLSPRLEKGYDIIYMGEIKKKGYQTYAWKLIFKDGGDEVFTTISFKSDKTDGKVAGFYTH